MKTSVSMTKEVAEKAQASFLCRNDVPKYAGGGVSEFMEIAAKFVLQAAQEDRQKVIDFFTQEHEAIMRERVEAMMAQYAIKAPAEKKTSPAPTKVKKAAGRGKKTKAKA